MSDIVLSTINARYIHSSLGLRYLMANMMELEQRSEIVEFVIHTRAIDIVETLLQYQPRIIGFGVYIWNIEQTTQTVALLKKVSPNTVIILGGPEVSYEYQNTGIAELTDYIITGAADIGFYRLCCSILNGAPPDNKILHADPPPLSQIRFPYDYYSDEDIANRIIYIEASRGCPFKCEFCLSSLDKTAWPFELDVFLQELDKLYRRGARRFKFVDRTFNIKIANSVKILQYFLNKANPDLFLHFEVIPDHLPEPLKKIIQLFPEGAIQFEIGIQSFNPDVQTLISRKQNNAKTKANLHWLRNASKVHIHADLILGLPGEDLDSIAKSFNQLVELNPHEIQVGILKRLRGSPIIRHSGPYEMKYNPYPPYNILSTNLIDFTDMQRLNRFARYWDMIANSGRFLNTKPIILKKDPFIRFLKLSDWLFNEAKQTHKISLERLFEYIYKGLITVLDTNPTLAADTLWRDYQTCGLKKRPSFATEKNAGKPRNSDRPSAPLRQLRHLKS